MKIAQSMPGIEGLLTAPASAQAGAGASKVSFAESLGESLTTAASHDAAEPSVKPENAVLKAGTLNQKADGQATKVLTKPAPVAVIPKMGQGAIASGSQATPVNAVAGLESSTDGVAVPDVKDDQVKGKAPASVPILKPGQQTAESNGASQVPVGEAGDTSAVVERPVDERPDPKQADALKQVNGGTKISGADAEKGKETEASLRHKEKHVSDEIVSQGQPSQESQQIAPPGMVEPSVAADVPMPIAASPHKPSNEGLQPSPVAVKEAAGPGGKAGIVHALRQKQSNPAATKAPHAPEAMTGATTENAVEEASRDGRSVVDPRATKLDAAEHKSLSQEKEQAATQIALQAGTGVALAAAQTHASVAVPAEKIANAAQANTVSASQMDTTASHTTYAPGDHGTVTATPTALEVGVPGGSHGWLKVRAELGGDGSVHASMSSNSAAGTEALRRDLPQLTSYLHQEQVRVSSVVVHAAQAPAEFSNQASNDGRGQGMSGGSPHGHRGDAGSGSAGSSHSQARVLQATSAGDGDVLLPGGFGSAGGWLSVRA